MTWFISSGFASLVLVSGLVAQQELTLKKVGVAPVHAGTYHPALGFQPNQTLRLGPESIWNNNRLSNYYTISPTDQEWVDEGVLPN